MTKTAVKYEFTAETIIDMLKNDTNRLDDEAIIVVAWQAYGILKDMEEAGAQLDKYLVKSTAHAVGHMYYTGLDRARKEAGAAINRLMGL